MRVALILTGPPGAGKTSVLEALTTLFELERREYSALEAEQFGWGLPWLPTARWVAQLEAVIALQREAGRRVFLVTATTETREELRAVAEAIAAERTLVVLLVASPEVAAGRIERREPDRWPGKAALVAHARELAASMPRELDGADLVLETDGRDPEEVARSVLDALTPLLPTDRPSTLP